MIDSAVQKNCMGCYMCQSLCPNGAIVMTEDNEGFFYPKTDVKLCTECGACLKKCPANHVVKAPEHRADPRVFAAWSMDATIRENSTSGGVFSELALATYRKNGLVAGAVYDENHRVVHFLSDSQEELPRIRQSKYVQSDLTGIYESVKQVLQSSERSVLFCGTPCHIAALRTFLGREYDNLLLVDFICRGVNSTKAYKKYLAYLEREQGAAITKVWFKNKKHGWNRFSTRVDFENGKVYCEDRNTDLYMQGYIRYNLYMRPSCYHCQYKNFPRLSDITLADFWGIGEHKPYLDEDKGTSLVLLNSKRGETAFERLSDAVFREKCTLNMALGHNKCIYKPPYENPKRGEFLRSLDTIPFDVAMEKYTKPAGMQQCKVMLQNGYYALGHFVKYQIFRMKKSKM